MLQKLELTNLKVNYRYFEIEFGHFCILVRMDALVRIGTVLLRLGKQGAKATVTMAVTWLCEI